MHRLSVLMPYLTRWTSVRQQWHIFRPVSLMYPLPPIYVCVFKMRDLFIQHASSSLFPYCFIRYLVCLWQQPGGALDASSPVVRLYPSRLSDTGLCSCHKAGLTWDRLFFLHQNNEEIYKTFYTVVIIQKCIQLKLYHTCKNMRSWWMNRYCW